MLTGGGLALANELKHEHGKRIFLDMKLFDIGARSRPPCAGWRSSIWIS
jgi:orotidine-5'-phosphate decarboxylase